MARVDAPAPSEPPPDAPGAFEPHDLSGLFAAPRWLRDLGTSAWLAVGVALFVAGVMWLLSLTQTIVAPVITASVVAAVASPLVGWLQRRGLGRGAATALLLLGGIVLAVGVVVLILAGIGSQHDALAAHLASAKDALADGLANLGVDRQTATSAVGDAATTVDHVVPVLLQGVSAGLAGVSSLVVFLSLTLLSGFFLLKDGHEIRAWAERHMRVPPPVAHQMGDRLLESLRGYFVGVTAVAVFNAVIVLAGALILGVPLAGTIAIVTFLGAYVPYLGAWAAGAFAVLVALGGAGTDAAIGMAIIQLLANGLLQQLVQPIAYGAALGIHPLAVLIVTIAGGALFGAVGLILAAPVTAALTRIAVDLSRARARPEGEAAGRPAP
jgi:predicted PurR-regulated permease PerM